MRSLLAKIKTDALSIREAGKQVAASAKATHTGLRDRERESGGNSRIDDAAAVAQHRYGRVCGVDIRGRNHSAPAVNGQSAPAFEILQFDRHWLPVRNSSP